MSSLRSLPERKQLRLPAYDYSSPGPYFVTLVTQDRLHLFGEVTDKEMHFDAAGEMVVRWWNELANKYPNVYPGCHIVMPNHFHGVLEISTPADEPSRRAERRGPSQQSAGPLHDCPAGLSLPEIMQWFKTITTNEYIRGVKSLGWRRFNGKLWQRSYYEHIIREDRSYEWVMKYIEDNPYRWDEDEENR